MSENNVVEKVKEEEISEKKNIKERPKPEIIVSEALEKSIEIISRFDYKLTTEEHIIEYKTCFFCKNQFPTVQGKNHKCHTCDETFCVKHRNILNHSCKNINPNLKRYLAAKNLIKEKKRMRKLLGN